MKVKDLKGFPEYKINKFGMLLETICGHNGYNKALEEIGNLKIWDKKLNIKEIKTGLLANNNWFYDYLNGKISIGKFCDNIAQFIVEEKEGK